MRHTGNRLHRIPRQSGRLRSADRLEVVLSTVPVISSLEIVALEIAVRPAEAPAPCVALDERSTPIPGFWGIDKVCLR